MSVGLVWFKRDLRLRDHQPLAQAAQCERAFGLFIIEPAWLQSRNGADGNRRPTPVRTCCSRAWAGPIG
ncbi:deoxyribodipyrimidine photo-lyase [Herbaspirillum sp. BH-1]|uniref:Deoxyribodipyrimidine photolyase n=1 Tax=Herbaspirillum frisingense TaxID=92645 RepID=A0ABU1PNR3_9BURK|nr:MULTISPECIES: deoxyribodipyrimidine photo-lyase [Herbaspirillum]MDR6586773.1 deoxyribodipyrimidine photolyase [Herbaspirillum frisingense]PLY58035.1 deoxyribodipyrimidine photo-lyase [Herbaspirillum sp. BH-1]